MKGASSPALAFCILLASLCMCVHAQKCPRSFNISSQSVKMSHCKHLGELGATLSWTYHAENGSIDMAFKAKPASTDGWVAWGINPDSSGMVGTQALLAFRQSNGTIFVGTYKVISKSKALLLSNLSFPVTHLRSEYRHRGIAIYATLILPYNKTMVNQTWQVGSTVDASQPRVHAFDIANLKSFGTIDLLNAAIPSAAIISIPSPSPSSYTPSPSTGISTANAHPTVSWISLTFPTLLTASAIRYLCH